MNDEEKYEYEMLDEDFESNYDEEDLSWIEDQGILARILLKQKIKYNF